MYYIIYKITNLSNKKIYIGAHRTTDLEDSYMSSSKLVKSAIRKYGLENFRKEILFVFSTPEEMFAKEKELVNEEFIARTDTYNITCGGLGSWGHWHGTERHREEAKRGGITAIKNLHEYLKNNPEKRHSPPNWTGRRHKPDTIAKMQNAKKGRGHGQHNSQFGTVWCVNISDENYVNRKKFKKDSIPEGWISVAEHRDNRKNKNNPAYGRSWFNDGKQNYYLKRDDPKIQSLGLEKKRIL